MVDSAQNPKDRYMQLVERLRKDRWSYFNHWRDLGDYVFPRRFRWFIQNVSTRGERRNHKIIDSTGTLAARTLRAGMMSGLTSPSRPWFELVTPDPGMMQYGPVKEWLREVTRRMRLVFARSNFYNSLSVLYGDMGTFATGSMVVVEHPKEIIRCFVPPIGTYMLATNQWQEVDTFTREFMRTARQMVDQFGIDNVSEAVRNEYNRGGEGEWHEVFHVVQPNPDWDPARMHGKHKPWKSVYFEKGGDNKLLSESGFDEFPVMAPRWDVSGDDVYGCASPGMDALGDIKSLQFLRKMNAKAIDKSIDPPLMGPTSLRGNKVSLLPGDVTYVDIRDANQGLKPIHEVKFDTQGVLLDIQDHRSRINQAYYRDLFLLVANSNDHQMTAREIAERHEEKMSQLGPVLERVNDELLSPAIDRTFNIMLRRGLIPPPPPEIQGADVHVEYISIMAQAQKMVATAGIERLMGFVGEIAGAKPEALDKIDEDAAIDEYADMIGVPPKIVRPEEQVQQIRQQRAEQQRAQEQAAMAQQLAQGAKTLSEADTGGDNALTRLTGMGGGS